MPVVGVDVASDERTADSIENHRKLEIGAFLTAPYVSDGDLKFALIIYHTAAYEWRASEINLMRELATRVRMSSERKCVEECLRHSEADFRQLAETVPQLIWVYGSRWLARLR